MIALVQRQFGHLVKTLSIGFDQINGHPDKKHQENGQRQNHKAVGSGNVLKKLLEHGNGIVN